MFAPTTPRGQPAVLYALGLNLALGMALAWTVLWSAVSVPVGGSFSERMPTLGVGCVVFALVMIPAGHLQAWIGPRWVALGGAVLAAVGSLLASVSTGVQWTAWGGGVIAGAGLGLGYAAAIPAALKWFPRNQSGFVAGIVVSGAALALLGVVMLIELLLETRGLTSVLYVVGGGMTVLALLCAWKLEAPPPGYDPELGRVTATARRRGTAPAARRGGWAVMLSTPQFYRIWLCLGIGAGTALVAMEALLTRLALPVRSPAVLALIAVLTLGCAAGGILYGICSDRIGRERALWIVFTAQAAALFVIRLVTSGPRAVAVGVVVGACFGACFAVFPALTRDYFGVRRFGANYGLVFSAWGVGGLLLPMLSHWIYARTGSFDLANIVSGVLLLGAAAMAAMLQPPTPTRWAVARR